MTRAMTWGECLDYTLKYRPTWRNGGGRKSAIIYSGYFTKLRGYTFPAEKIRPAVMTQCQAELEEDNGLMKSSLNRFISAVSTVLNFCKEQELFDFDVPKFKRLKEDKAIRYHFTKDQVNELVKSSREVFYNDNLADIIMTAAYTGMRQGELLKLKAKDVDLLHQLIYVGGRPDVKTKSGDYRAIPIHTHVLPILQTRLEYANPNVCIFGDDWTDRHQLLKQFKNYPLRLMNLEEGYCFHSLRHSFAMFHVRGGTNFRTLMDLMGHRNISTTLIYGKSDDEGRALSMANI